MGPTTAEDTDFASFIQQERESTLASYRARPDNIRENSGQELAIIQGGYGRKQVQELVQNAVDALDDHGGRIQVTVTARAVYVANDGRPFDRAGIKTLLHSNMSDKRDEQIGRFGLGFKSVLEVSDSPQVFSASGAFGFDAEASRRELQPLFPGLDHYPVLRLPFVLDRAAEAGYDEVLSELLQWAVTVIRLPLRSGGTTFAEQVRDFPPRFMLFTPKVERFTIDDRAGGRGVITWIAERAATSVGSAQDVELTDGQSSERWLVVSGTHQPSPQAMKDAGSLHARAEMTVAWAAPMDVPGMPRRSTGAAWNHFPTKMVMRVPGIVNAPFKMNDDRVSVLEDDYNSEIFSRTLPRLLLAALPLLRTEHDPARHLDYFPARGREDTAWVKQNIIDPLTEALAATRTIPDLSGDLRSIDELAVRPQSMDDEPDTKAAWTVAASIAQTTRWVHESALMNTFRSALVDRLLALTKTTRKDETEWIEGLTAARTTSAYATAIAFAAEFVERHADDSKLLERATASRIVLMADGSVTRLADPLFFPSSSEQDEPGVVDWGLFEAPGLVASLRRFGATTLDGINLFKRVLDEALEHPEDPELALTVWRAAERFSTSEVLNSLDQRGANSKGLLVHTEDGTWRKLSEVWLGGRMLDPSRPEDARLVVARDHPFLTREVCRQLGIPATLPEQRRVRAEAGHKEWAADALAFIRAEVAQENGPSADARLTATMPTPVTPRLEQLQHASLQARAAATAVLLERPQPAVTLSVEAVSRPGSAGPARSRSFTKYHPGPDVRWIRHHGVLKTQKYGLMPVSGCCQPVAGVPDDLLPIPVADDVATVVQLAGLPQSRTPSAWQTIYAAAEQALATEDLHLLYGHCAAEALPVPRMLTACTGADNTARFTPDECRVPVDDETSEHLRLHTSLGVISTDVVLLDQALTENWSIEEASIEFSMTISYDLSKRFSDVRTVKDRFPYLGKAGGRQFSKLNSYSLVPCRTIDLVTSNDFDDVKSVTESVALEILDDDKQIYFRDTLQDEGLLGQLAKSVGSTRTGADLIAAVKQAAQESERDNLWVELRKIKDTKGKVVHLLGEERLRELVPESALDLLEASGEKITTDLLYSLAQSTHGSGLWNAIVSHLPEEGTSEYLRDVGKTDLKELGFDDSFFETKAKPLPAREEFLGPMHMRPLHDYQESTLGKIVERLSSPPGSNKALVQLPTGSGKTRVAVESLIRLAARQPESRRLYVWIAQSDELCEQAVEAWGEAWSSLGLPGERMAVSRLWGSRRAQEESDVRLHVVVASIQTLRTIAGAEPGSPKSEAYRWLSDPDVVVIDEAHAATAPSYTQVLRWFGRSTGQRGKGLLGLSATPFRGTSEAQTDRLVKRFDTTLIQPDQFTADSAHAYLQEHRVLARVRQEELDGITLQPLPGTRLSSSDEPENQRALLEKRIDLESVANDEGRNRRIIAHIEQNLDRVHHAIVFAASVEHAQALAAVLTARGITAAAIHGKTDIARRRSLIQDFRDGRLRVLTNFDVLTQGFDAPKVDTVYLCRPTFSPNKYIQMVGRGLRGPANGGSDEVLIVNIEDNLDNFGGGLAYTEFQYLWEDSNV